MKQRIARTLRRCGSAAAAARLHATAATRGTQCKVDIDPTAAVSPAIRLAIEGPGRIAIRVGPRSIIEGGVLLQLGPGAQLDIGPDVTIRRGCVLNVTGHLTFVGTNLLSWGSVVHCAAAVTFEQMAGTGEMITVVDGSHYRRNPDDHWYHNGATAPVVIGYNAWLSSKSTVGKGVRVGAAATVAANSLVNDDVPDECLAMGVPAQIVRRHINRLRAKGAGEG
jgi:acetyltransferase-like isoleucine patch superfamily enzyme